LDKRLGVPRACLDVAEKKEFLTSPGLELWHPGRQTGSQTLYRLRYFGSSFLFLFLHKLLEFMQFLNW
jgi:hypothetical protein